MAIGILDPFSGISGDMTLGALVEVGLDADWLRALPSRLELDGVGVRVERVRRAGIACTKVDFEIPPQPHARGIREIQQLVERAGVPQTVRERANRTFAAIATVEGSIHGVEPDHVHLHEVGAVDAILDVVGAVWGFELLGIERVYSAPIALGDGTVTAAHGTLPVPAPATMKLLEGHVVRPGPDGAGELVTPTGAALVRVLSSGPPPVQYVPLRSGFGAGTKEFKGRANALRLIVAESVGYDGVQVETLVQLATDVDDLPGEYIAAVSDALRADGALDVVLVPTTMKKGRPGARIEVLCTTANADALESVLFVQSGSLGVRRTTVERRALPRETRTVQVMGHAVRVKVATLPSGRHQAKAEYDDVVAVAEATGLAPREVSRVAALAAEQVLDEGVPGAASRGSLPSDSL
ncbi:MAG TPA: nickel pincer cofactor biosynthesis protein LarC [Gemmatimonadaceae bacterium]|nr:nickel pincer cofactor biosynthesis protein LarC [Gemmatimonadaceae bacterium]